MTTYFDEQFGGGSPGVSLTNVNTAFDLISGTAPTFVADSPIPGAQSMLVNIVAAALSSGRGQLGASRSVIFINYPIKANAAWATGNWFPHEARALAVIRADVRFPSGIPTMRNATTAVWTSGVTLATGVWLTCEHKIDNTAGKQSFTVWDATGAVVVASGDQTYNSGTMDNIAAGNTTSIANVNVTIGRIRVGDTSFGPIAFTSAPAENVTPTFAAGDPTTAVAANDGGAALALAATDPAASIAAADTGVAFTLAANDATVSTASFVNAPAEAATLTLTAADPAAAVAPSSGTAAVTYTAGDPTPALAVNAENVAVTFTAADPTITTGVLAPAGLASWTTAVDPAALAVAANAEAAAQLYAAQTPTVVAVDAFIPVFVAVDTSATATTANAGSTVTSTDVQTAPAGTLATHTRASTADNTTTTSGALG